MTTPETGINYRIQNYEFEHYMDQNILVNYNLVLRSIKPTFRRQQWKLIDAGSNAYYIQNVDNPELYICCSQAGSNFILANLIDAWNYKWSLSYDTLTDSYSIYTQYYNENMGYFTYYYIATTDGISTMCYNNGLPVFDSMKWKFIPATDPAPDRLPLPTGYYRLRTFNGLSLLTLPSETGEDTSIYIKSQVPQNSYQKWYVVRQPNGLYNIQNAGAANPTYLGCRSPAAEVGDNVIGVTTIYEWVLRTIGNGLAWSINLPQSKTATPLSLGFADYEARDNENVSLEATDTAPSQLWFFESYVALGQDQVHAERLIHEGTYELQSCADMTIFMNVLSTPYRITAGAASKFNLKYNSDNGPEFTLSYDTGDGLKFVADLGGYLGFSITATTFVLLSENKLDPGWYLCKPDAGYPRRIVSARLTAGANDNNVFCIDNMTPGQTLHMWKLNPAD